MLYELFEKTDILSLLFYQILYMSIVGSIVGLIVYIVRNIFDKKISGKIKCILWCIVIAVFLLPIRFEVPTNHTYTHPEIVNRVEDIKNIGIHNSANIDIDQNGNNNSLLTSDNVDNKSIDTAKSSISVKNFLINTVIPFIWITGVITALSTYLAAAIRLRKKISKKQLDDERITEISNDCKKQLNIKKDIKIILLNEKKSPGIFGTINPCILLNNELLNNDSQTIKYIFLHEFSHYKRKDTLFNYLLLLTVSIHWFNPVIWFLFKKIRQDIELGTDELASKKLTKHQRKEYAMVLINSLKNYSEEHGTANMLCISDTEKNMKRRISMLKGKKKNLFVGLFIIVIVICAVTATVFFKGTQTPNTDASNNTNTTQQTEAVQNSTENATQTTANPVNNTLQDNEKNDLENYVQNICNRNLCNRLPEFDSINDADRIWIYSHITRKDNVYAMTEREITEDLQSQFGSELILDVKKDTASNDNVVMPTYNAEENNYTLPTFGMDNSVRYLIHSIEKNNNKYTVVVIEYNLRDDLTTNDIILGAYDDSITENWKWKEIYRGKSGETDTETLKNIVLEKKSEFQSYEIAIEKNNNGKFVITQSKKI